MPAAPASPPEPDPRDAEVAALRAQQTALQQQFAEREAQRQAELQQQQQQQWSQRWAQQQAAIGQVIQGTHQELLDAGLDANKAGALALLAQQAALYNAAATQHGLLDEQQAPLPAARVLQELAEYRQSMPGWSQQIRQHVARETAMDQLGPNATVAEVRELAATLAQYDSPAALRKAGEMLGPVWAARRQQATAQQQAAQRQQAIASGATRVEGGGGGSMVTGMSDQEFINRWADPDGGIAQTRENAQRARRLTEMGVMARAPRR